jgi:ribosomal protein S12 methylthiotransferase accessory factor
MIAGCFPTNSGLKGWFILTTSLRLKPELQGHVVSADEVALLSEGSKFALRGKIYAAIIPLLDGKKDNDTIVALLSSYFNPALVYYALDELKLKEYVVTADAGNAELAAAAWWSSHDVAYDTLASLSHSTSLVDGGAHPPAFQALQAAMQAEQTKGPPAVFPLTVIAASDYLDERFTQAVEAGLAAGRTILPVRLAGASIWVGPLLDQETSSLFPLLIRRLTANRPADVATRASGAEFPLMPPLGLPVTFDLAAAWIASAALAIVSGHTPAFLKKGLLSLNPWSLETTRHPISVATATNIPNRSAAIELAPAPKRFTLDGGHRTCTPQESLARLEQFVGPIAGVVPAIEKVPNRAGMHVYVCTQISDRSASNHRANRVLGRPGGAVGKGAGDPQARVSCLAEAIERYSCHHQGHHKLLYSRLDQISEPVVAPQDLLLFSHVQYSKRNQTNEINGRGFNWVPGQFDPERAIDWSPAWSLTHGRQVWLPADFCYFGYSSDRNHDFCKADSNGCASGNTLEEAIQQGFFELVERDACALWWYNRVMRPSVDLDSFDDPFFASMQNSFKQAERELVVLDITSDLSVPTVMAISWRQSDGGGIHMGLGCHLEARLAVSRALAELNQGAVDEFGDKDPASLEGFDIHHTHWLREATIKNQPYLRPADSPRRVATDFTNEATHDVRDDLLISIEKLRAKGLEMIVLDHTRPDIGFPVARVVVPGLRHFWARHAPGRLYDAPVSMGWLDRPKTESELNPIAFFL